MRNVGKLLCAAVALALLLWLGVFARTQFRHLRVSNIAHSMFAGRRAKTHPGGDRTGKIYPFSVVPGGVYSSEELARSRRIDPVVAKHYAGFGDSVSVQKTVQDTYMYVSYRKEDKVYWTKTKHRISRGEYVVTDGKSFARARCGNRLSPVPQEPVMDAGEPGDDRLDKPEPPSDMYLASLEPGEGDPLFSIPPADGDPAPPDSNATPKLAETPRSAFAGTGGGAPFPAGGFGSTPYVLPRNSASNSSPSSTGTQTSIPGQTVTPSVPLGGRTTTTGVPVPTPEPSGWALLAIGGISVLLCTRSKQGPR